MEGMETPWQRQAKNKPLFPDLEWSRPENKQHAGKLLIIGGNAYGFASPAEAYQEAAKAGIGTARTLLPDALQKTLGKHFEASEFAPSTPSGSFAQKALLEFLTLAQWADATLIDGDLGRNSETAIVLEKFTQKYQEKLVLANDAADYFINPNSTILDREETLLVLNFAQLQKLAMYSKHTTAFTTAQDLMHFISALRELASLHEAHIAVQHLDNVITAVGDRVSATKLTAGSPIQTTKLAAHAAVWWLQHPNKPYESITTAALAIAG